MLTRLAERDGEIDLLAAGEPMGAGEARAAGFEPQIVYRPSDAGMTVTENTAGQPATERGAATNASTAAVVSAATAPPRMSPMSSLTPRSTP